MNKLTLTSLALAIGMVMSAQAIARPTGYPNGRPFQAIKADFQEVKAAIADVDADVAALQADVTMIKDDIADLSSDLSDLADDVSMIKDDVGDIKSDVAALAEVLSVQVAVDTEYCAGAGVQCFTSEAADDGNNNPVRLIVSVSRGGAPVGGLVEGDFALAGGLVPPGGTTTGLCSAGDCGASNFGGAAGLYAMFVVTVDLSNWDNGVYGSNLSVTDPAGGSGLALVAIDIPEAPEAP